METTFYSGVDRLGMLLAQIADLNKQANDIKKTLKEMVHLDNLGNTFEGNLFRAVVIEQERVSYDTDVLKSAVDDAILELAKRESFVVSVKVTGRVPD